MTEAASGAGERRTDSAAETEFSVSAADRSEFSISLIK